MGRPTTSARLLIVQPYIAEYRAPLYPLLKEQLHEQQIELSVAASTPTPTNGARLDDTGPVHVDVPLTERTLTVAGRRLVRRRIRPVLAQIKPDLIIAEQAVKNLETFQLLIRGVSSTAPRVALWGQGIDDDASDSGLVATVRSTFTRRADWFFAYTLRGGNHVIDHGFPADRVTILHNTMDLRALRAKLELITEGDVENFARELSFEPQTAALFIGGVDERKGIRFLLDAATRIRTRIPTFTLLIGGAGDLTHEVVAAEQAGAPVRYLGRLDGARKALALRSAQVLTIPEWVGLVAVDSFAAGIPIVTTDFSTHSTEFEYLTPNVNAVITAHDPQQYVDGVVALLNDRPRLRTLQSGAAASSDGLAIEDMADRFVAGTVAWRDAGRR